MKILRLCSIVVFLSQSPVFAQGASPLMQSGRVTNAVQSDSAFSVLGRWPWGPCYAVDAYRDYVLIANGSLLQTLDVSNPETPRIASEYLLDAYTNDIVIRDSLAYVAHTKGFSVFNIATPLQPLLLGSCQPSGLPAAVGLADSFAFVHSSFGGLSTVNVTDPSQPVVMDQLGLDNGWFVNRARIGYAADLSGFPVIVIVDASNPMNMRYEYFTVGGQASFASVCDTLLFININQTYLKVYSIVNPLSPRSVTQFQMGTPVSAISQQGGLLYVSTRDSGLQVIDVSDIYHPRELKRVSRSPTPKYYAKNMLIHDSKLFVANGVGLWTLSVSGQDTARSLSYFPTGYIPNRITRAGNLLLVTSNFAGLRLLDATSVSSLRPLGVAEIPGGCMDVSVNGSFAYCITRPIVDEPDSISGLWTIDIANPLMPRIVSHEYLPLQPFGTVTTSGQRAYVTQSDSGLVIYSLASPDKPVRIGTYLTHGYPRGFETKDSIGYLALADSGVIVLNTRDPNSVTRLGRILQGAHGLSLQDTFAIVADATGLAIVNISNPMLPTFVSSTAISGPHGSTDVATTKSYAYLANGILNAVDIRDIRHPYVFAVLDQPWFSPLWATLKEDTLLTADESGIWALRQNPITDAKENILPVVQAFNLHACYPNPFNPRTTINYELPTVSRVQLKVYDLLGREVAALVDEVKEAGEHRTAWDASRFARQSGIVGLASGVYLVRMTASSGNAVHTQTRKVVLMR